MSQHPASKPLRWSLLAAPVAGVMLLAGCSGGGDTGSSDGASADGFSIMVAQANDADDFYAQMAAAYTEETGTEIEVIPYPSDAYNTQVTTQFQAGNAAQIEGQIAHDRFLRGMLMSIAGVFAAVGATIYFWPAPTQRR